MDDWQLMLTAPKDGTVVELKRDDCPGYDTKGSFVDGKWRMGNFFLRRDGVLLNTPTHWRHKSA